MDLELQLAERQRLPARNVWTQQRRQRLKLPALNIDLQDINVRVPVLLHQRLKGVHLRGVLRAILVLPSESNSMEVRPVRLGRRDLGTKRLDAEVVPPHLAVRRAVEDLRLERRLEVDPERVHDAVRLLRDAREAAHPLAAVAERAEALDLVRAVERRREEVPCVRARTRVVSERSAQYIRRGSGAGAEDSIPAPAPAPTRRNV